MLIVPQLRLSANALKIVKRNIGILAPVLQKASDPIQQLFIDKIREYDSNVKKGTLQLPPEFEVDKKSELEKISAQYGIKESEALEFPSVRLQDVEVDSLLGKTSPKA